MDQNGSRMPGNRARKASKRSAQAVSSSSPSMNPWGSLGEPFDTGYAVKWGPYLGPTPAKIICFCGPSRSHQARLRGPHGSATHPPHSLSYLAPLYLPGIPMGPMGPGSRVQHPGPRIQGPGTWYLVPGTAHEASTSWIQDHGSRMHDPGLGSWIQRPASRILDPG